MACSWAEVSSVTRDLPTPKPALLISMSTGWSLLASRLATVITSSRTPRSALIVSTDT
jgi:hypothetical protein